MDEKTKPVCPICNLPMGKAGYSMSGSNRIQRYKCNHCGKTTMKSNLDTDSRTNHRLIIVPVPYNQLQYAQLQVRSIKSNMSVIEYLQSLPFREH